MVILVGVVEVRLANGMILVLMKLPKNRLKLPKHFPISQKY